MPGELCALVWSGLVGFGLVLGSKGLGLGAPFDHSSSKQMLSIFRAGHAGRFLATKIHSKEKSTNALDVVVDLHVLQKPSGNGQAKQPSSGWDFILCSQPESESDCCLSGLSGLSGLSVTVTVFGFCLRQFRWGNIGRNRTKDERQKCPYTLMIAMMLPMSTSETPYLVPFQFASLPLFWFVLGPSCWPD